MCLAPTSHACYTARLMDAGDILKTFAWAMTPIGELRLSIPLGIITYDLPWYAVFPISIAGNIAPVLLILPALDRIARFLQSFPNPLGRLLAWRVAQLQKRQGKRFERYGALALLAFVAVPLPLTGAWTGCLAAWVFRVPYRRAVAVIFPGVLVAGVIVTALVESGSHLSIFLSER
ncbi:MAG: small multi-drug export protein [Chloroflexi bacterium]|nr:small multi-drug export protein [Chloroflexota bacterium]